ncbi:hypothetical protein JCM10914A_06590 [Paenibacillus sp. JCM 10914]
MHATPIISFSRGWLINEFAEFVFDILNLDKHGFRSQEQDMAMIHFLEIETVEYDGHTEILEETVNIK